MTVYVYHACTQDLLDKHTNCLALLALSRISLWLFLIDNTHMNYTSICHDTVDIDYRPPRY